MSRFLVITFAIVLLSGCMSVSGLDANSNFACKAPDGVLCESMSGIYANAEQNNLPGQRVHHSHSSTVPVELSSAKKQVVLTKPINSGTPIRSTPKVLRVWFSPWQDTDGDLHDQSYVYLTIDTGHWLIEHNRHRIQETYKPIHAPSKSSTASPAINEVVSHVQTGSEEGQVSIGVAQPRPSIQEAAAMMGNIQTPDYINQQ